MSTTQKIALNTGTQIIGKAISTLLGLFAIGMMTRYLGTEKFGWYITTMAFLQFIAILIDFGLIPVTAQMLGEKKIEEKKLISNLLGFRLTTAIIFLGLAPLIALLLPYPQIIKIAISFTVISFLSTAINQIFIGFFQTKLKMHIQAFGEVVGRIVLVIGLWLLIYKNAGFLPIMLVIVFSSIAYTLVMIFFARKETKILPSFDFDIWKKIIKKSWPITISIIFNVVYLKGDTLLLSLFRGQTEVGIYGAAYKVIDILAQTAMLLMGVILPLLAFQWIRNKQEFKKQYQQAFDAMMLLAVPTTIGLIFTANKIMGLVAGKEFVASGRPLQILAIAIFGVYLGAVFGHTAVAIDKQKQTMWIYISNAFITLIGYFIFIPKFGMYGAAWMTVFSELYAGVLLFLVITHYTKEKLQLKTFGKMLLASFAMGLSIYLLNSLHVILLVMIGALVYSLVLYLIGGISKETIREILTSKKQSTN